MKTYFWFIFSLFLICSSQLFSQPDSLYFQNNNKDDIQLGWRTKKEVGIYLNQVSFTNWNAGGANSISAILSAQAQANYKSENLFWNSSVAMRYGINKQEEERTRKTEDAIELISNFGYQENKESNWFYSARFSFNTQFADGYNYPDKDSPISRLMAPGYMFFGAGLEYGRHIERFSLYVSPLTVKTTFVLDDNLANSGAFGVDPAIYDLNGNLLQTGKKIRQELGILLTNQYQEEVLENVKVNSIIRLYTDYLNDFGNIDVDWELTLDMQVNSYIKAMISSHLRYDNDIKTSVERNEITNEEIVISGAKLQWKQLLGVGVVVDIDNLIQS